MRRNLFGTVERLEDRRLLAVVAEVVGGDLVVSGNADGPVEIVSTGLGGFDVIDDGNVVSVEGVEDDILVDLDHAGTSDDEVSMQLGDADIDQVRVDLGDGDNSLIVEDGDINRSLLFRGGIDDDSLEIGEDVAIGRSLRAFMGSGDNTLSVHGTVDRSLTLLAGEGDDEVELGESSEIGGRATLLVGDGNNTTTLAGSIGGSLYYRGGVGDDLIDVLATSTVEGRALLNMGDGDNTLNIDGVMQSHVTVRAGDGDDLVSIGESATVEGRLRLRLGEGDNEVVDARETEPEPPSASTADMVLKTLGLPAV